MALDTLSNISNALSQLFEEELYKQWNRMAVTAGMIPAKPGRGKNAAWDVEFSGATASTVAEGADVQESEFQTDVDQPAVLNWAHYRSSFKVSETEIDAAASSMGTADALMDIFGDRLLGSAAKVAQAINVDLWTGTGTDGSGNATIIGLTQGPIETTGTYAGILRSSFSEWQGNKLANGGTARPLSFDLLYQLEQQIFTNSGEAPSVIITTPAIFRKYAALFEQVRRLTTDGMGPLEYRAGAETLFWKGIPVIRDRNAAAGTLAMLTPHYIESKFLPRQMSPADAVQMNMQQLEGSNGREVKNMTGIPARVALLAKTGDSIKASVKTTLQMLVKRPNAQGLIVDILET